MISKQQTTEITGVVQGRKHNTPTTVSILFNTMKKQVTIN